MIEHYDGSREYNEGNANPMNSGPETTVLNSPSCEIAPSPCRRGKSASQVSGNNRIVATVTSKAQSHPTNVASESFFISFLRYTYRFTGLDVATVNSTGRMGNETGGNAKGTKSESNIKSSVMLSCGSWMACGPEFVSNTSVGRRTHLYEHFLRSIT